MMAASFLSKFRDCLDYLIHHPEHRLSIYVSYYEALCKAVVVYKHHYLK